MLSPSLRQHGAAVLRRLAGAARLSADVRNLISSKNRPLGFP